MKSLNIVQTCLGLRADFIGTFLTLKYVVFFKIIKSYFRETIKTSTSWLERMGKTAFLRFLRHSHFLFCIEFIEVLNKCPHACPGRSGPEPLILSEEEREERL